MSTVTVISEVARDVVGRVVDGRVLLAGDGLTTAIDWELKPEGLCHDGVCIPVRDPASLRAGEDVDLVAACRALGRATVVDAEIGVVSVALPAEERRRALTGLVAPNFTLPDLDGNVHELAEWRGQKRLLFAFSTW